MIKHLEALRRWIKRQGKTQTLEPGLSGDERKQLQAVNRTIEQLTRVGVSVPEDLRNIKLRLSAKDVSDEGNREVKERIKELEAFIEQIRGISQAALEIRNRLKGTGQHGRPRKRFGVSLLTLLKKGYLSTKDKLEFRRLKDGPPYEGKGI